MYGKSVINAINNNEKTSAPATVLPEVGISSLSQVPHLPHPKGFRRTGRPFKVSTEPSVVAPDALESAREWLRETGAKYVAFVSKGALNGDLQAFEPIPV